MFRSDTTVPIIAAATAAVVAASVALASTGGSGSASVQAATPVGAQVPARKAPVFTTPQKIDNPYLPLVPGTTFRYESVTAQGQKTGETGVVEVTGETRAIFGVPCVVVRDTATVDGQVVEDTIDWYAQDKAGNVWYFGEESKQYANGFLVAIDGSWRAGVDGALPGIVMEAAPAVGDVYRQEFAVGEAEDVAKVLALGQAVSVPFGGYTNALQTGDFSAFEPHLIEQKFYAPGVGFVLAIDPETGGREELVGVMTQ